MHTDTEREDVALGAAKNMLCGMLSGLAPAERRALLQLLLAATEG